MAAIQKFRYPIQDKRSDTERSDLRSAVRDQIEPWVDELQADAQAAAVKGVTILRDRRRAAGLTGFDLDGGQYPVAPYRLLVRGDDQDQLHGVLKNLDHRYAAQVVPIRELDSVYVLQDIDAGTRRLRCPGAVAGTMPGGKVGPSYFAMMGAVRKAVGGPEPASPPNADFTEVSKKATIAPGPKVVIIDTGVSAEVRSDGWLAGLARNDNLDLLNVVPLDDYLDLGAGHGTFTAGIVQQVAPAAYHLDVRQTLNTEGVADDLKVGQAIIQAAKDGAEIINLSLGLVTIDNKPPVALESAIRTAIRIAHEKHDKHLLLVCAAGNYGTDDPCWPAAFSEDFEEHVISVAALRRDYDAPTNVVGAEWSTHGDQVTISTFGQAVVSTYVVGRESPSNDPLGPDTFGPNSWAVWSGTSFAAPQVTGAIVRLMQEEGIATAYQAWQELMKQGTKAIPGYGTSIEILPV
jgi:subtilisin family serine protease